MPETSLDIHKSALLVIDMQNDLIKCQDGHFSNVTLMGQAKGIIENTASAIFAARQAGIPVIYACHVHRRDGADVVPTITDAMFQSKPSASGQTMVEGTPGAQIVDELLPAPEEHVIWKRRPSAFYNTDLELMLRTRGIDTVILTGVVTDGCMASTVRDARARDLHVIVLSDCCATSLQEDDDYFLKRVFPKVGRVRTAAEIIAAITANKN